jgi:hypothetical protein
MPNSRTLPVNLVNMLKAFIINAMDKFGSSYGTKHLNLREERT